LRYDREVIALRVRVSIVVALVAASLCAATPAHAAAVPTGAIIRTDRTVDVATFSRFIEARFRVVLRRVIAADIDRDGDVDIVAATDRGFFVWLNDGAGHLTAQSAKRSTAIDGQALGDTWREDESRDEETVQNEPPSPKLPTCDAHAPPASLRQPATLSTFTLHADPSRGTRTPRAPPATS
jgi:hypothetical protein